MIFLGLTAEESYNPESLVLYLAPHVPEEQLNLKEIFIIYSNSDR